MKCDDARAAYLTGDPETAHTAHLDSCPLCRAVLDDLAATRRLLAEDYVWEEPPADLGDKVIALISGPDTRSRPRRRYRFLIPAAAVAAIVAAAATFAVFAGNGADWEVALPGTDLAPDATAVVRGWNETAGTRLSFDIAGLAEAPEGAFYEVWFSQGSHHVSAGTFSGSGKIEMWSGVMRSDYPRIWVTLEPIDDDESPSGHTVLDTR